MKERNIWEDNFYPEDPETSHWILFKNLCRILSNPTGELVPIPEDFPEYLMKELPGEDAVKLLVKMRGQDTSLLLQPNQLERKARALVNGYRYSSYLSWKYTFDPSEYLP